MPAAPHVHAYRHVTTRPPRRGGVRRTSVGLAAMSLLVSGAASATAAPAASFSGWIGIADARLQRDRLVVLDQATLRVREPRAGGARGPVAFTYHRTGTFEVGLNRTRLRFDRAAFTERLAIRSSAGSLAGGRLAADDEDYLVIAGGRAVAPPVVWCCTPDGTEVVVESDGRADAPRVIGGGIDGDRVRLVLRGADGSVILRSSAPGRLADADAPDGSRTDAVLGINPGDGLVDIDRGRMVWSDDPDGGVVWIAVPSDAGPGPAVAVGVPGTVHRLWAAAGGGVVLTRQGLVWRVYRLTPAPSRRLVWAGRQRPVVGVGNGSVAIAEGRRILTSRGGRARRVATARGPVPALTADGDRVAWFERMRRRERNGWTRRTVARLGRVR
ncbi:MAG: hypothetical protein H6531_07365 [Actinobacteria bacterium]|nr:hypothetical protein [Actinomycetota bacterium]